METTASPVDAKGTPHPQDSGSIEVACYKEQACLYSKYPDTRLWAVKTGGSVKAEGGGSLRIWAEPSYIRKLRQQGSPLLSSAKIDDGFSTRRGFCKGQPLVSLDTTIPLCLGDNRPHKLLRVVHDGHTGLSADTVARGFDSKVKITPLTFQFQMQRHLNWNCRDPSPFMSSTNDKDKAVRMCACYEARGMTGITILEIDTTGEEWDASGSRIWEVQELLHRFCLPILGAKGYLKNEYLIESCIPPSKVTRQVDWDEKKDELDPGGSVRAAVLLTFKQSTSKKRKECDSKEDRVKNKRTRNYKCLKEA